MVVRKNGMRHGSQNTVLFRCFSALYCVVMAVLLFFWWKNTPDSSLVYRLSGLVSILLFTLVFVPFLRSWSEEWYALSRPKQPDPASDHLHRSTVVWIFLALLLVDGAIILFVWFLQWKLLGQADFRHSLELWSKTDSCHYLYIAKNWYLSTGPRERLVELVFLPGYPILVRAVTSILPNDLYAGMLVSAVSFAGAGTMLYCLARLDMDHRSAMRVLRYAVLLPGAFFYAAPQSESLFLLLSVSCIYLSRKRNWIPACLLGGLAAFTRSMGVLLLIPVGFELIRDLRQKDRFEPFGARRILPFLTLFLIPFGFALYCLICRKVSGNPFQWMIYQKENWHQQVGLFFQTAAFQAEQVVRCFQHEEYAHMVGVRIPNLLASFLALIVMAISIRRIRPSYGAYFVSYYVLAFGATNLLSGPRYLLVLFPFVFGIAEITRKRAVDIVMTLMTAATSLIYLLLFVYQCYIW